MNALARTTYTLVTDTSTVEDLEANGLSVEEQVALLDVVCTAFDTPDLASHLIHLAPAADWAVISPALHGE